MLQTANQRWTPTDSAELYEVARWGRGYFSVNEQGHVQVHPHADPDRSVDLKLLVDRLVLRGIDLPVLLRFSGILEHRLAEIHAAFRRAIEDHGYRGSYRGVYPIKVNQQRQVVEEVVNFGRLWGYGLEAGSKPELLAVVAMAEAETLIICNGFKDRQYIEMVLLAQKVGRHIIPVVEKFTELKQILEVAESLDVRPQIGMRVKLAAKGSGRWQGSAGHRSKFGLTATEILEGLSLLRDRGLEDCFKLLHFHMGSQITNIRFIKGALVEAARIYADLKSSGAGLQYLDVGGGLGVDYDGSQTNFVSSANYTLQEYANDVIYQVQAVCDDAEVEHPTIVTECGRAMVAYHSLLVFEALGSCQHGSAGFPAELPEEPPHPLVYLHDTYRTLTQRNLLEGYHDAQQAIDTAMTLFGAGHLSLVERSQAERMYWAIIRKVHQLSQGLDEIPEELARLDAQLADIYFSNLSIFQSMPDAWAIRQLFPVMPIHRLDEEPTRQAVLGDITCDSDGKLDQFIDRRDVRRTLPLHPLKEEPYCLAAFLLGAYQEILGDLHNLFGDTNAVHVRLSESNEVILESVIKGDAVAEVLQYVQFRPTQLLDRLSSAVEAAVHAGRLDNRQAGSFLKVYEQALNSYTYLQ